MKNVLRLRQNQSTKATIFNAESRDEKGKKFSVVFWQSFRSQCGHENSHRVIHFELFNLDNTKCNNANFHPTKFYYILLNRKNEKTFYLKLLFYSFLNDN